MRTVTDQQLEILIAERVATAKRSLALRLAQVVGDVSQDTCHNVLRDNPNTLAGVVAGIFAQTLQVLDDQGVLLNDPLNSK